MSRGELEVIKEVYRGIPYVLKLIGDKSSHIGVDGYWWVLENDNTPKEIVELYENVKREIIEYSDNFLYEDSLHSWNDNKTLLERKAQMIEVAKRDIDWLLDDALTALDTKLKERECNICALKEKHKLLLGELL